MPCSSLALLECNQNGLCECSSPTAWDSKNYMCDSCINGFTKNNGLACSL